MTSFKCLEINVHNNALYHENLLNLFMTYFNYLKRPKSKQHIAQTLQLLITPHSTAHLLALQRLDDEELVGFCFFNQCMGIESGGYYLWINDIYILPSCRRQGAASFLLKQVQLWAKQHQCGYIACIADNWNIASQTLFKRMGFTCSSSVWMDKILP